MCVLKRKKSTNNCRVFCYVDTDDATHSRIAGFKLTLVSSNSGAGILKPTFSHHTDAQRGQKWGLVSIFVHFFISLFFFREFSPSLLTPLSLDGRTYFIIYP